MNKAQRKRIEKRIEELRPLFELDALEATNAEGGSAEPLRTALATLQNEVEEIASEERDKFDNMSEGLQASATGCKIEECADALESIDWPDLDDEFSDADELAERLESLIEEIEAAIE